MQIAAAFWYSMTSQIPGQLGKKNPVDSIQYLTCAGWESCILRRILWDIRVGTSLQHCSALVSSGSRKGFCLEPLSALLGLWSKSPNVSSPVYSLLLWRRFSVLLALCARVACCDKFNSFRFRTVCSIHQYTSTSDLCKQSSKVIEVNALITGEVMIGLANAKGRDMWYETSSMGRISEWDFPLWHDCACA